MAFKIKEEPNTKAYGSIWKLGEILNLEPATKPDHQSYNHKELNSANNPNEQEFHSPLEPPEWNASWLHFDFYLVWRHLYWISGLQNCKVINLYYFMTLPGNLLWQQ